MQNHLTIEEVAHALSSGILEGMPQHTRSSRLPKTIDGDPEAHLRIVIRGAELRDAVVKFSPQQLKKWQNPSRFEIRFHPKHPDEIILLAIRNPNLPSVRGMFTITQKNEGRIGTSTLTWKGMKRKPPGDKTRNDSVFVPIILIDKICMVIDVSALERDE